MELIKPGINIDFVGKIKYAIVLSAVLFLVSIGSVPASISRAGRSSRSNLQRILRPIRFEQR